MNATNYYRFSQELATDRQQHENFVISEINKAVEDVISTHSNAFFLQTPYAKEKIRAIVKKFVINIKRSLARSPFQSYDQVLVGRINTELKSKLFAEIQNIYSELYTGIGSTTVDNIGTLNAWDEDVEIVPETDESDLA